LLAIMTSIPRIRSELLPRAHPNRGLEPIDVVGAKTLWAQLDAVSGPQEPERKVLAAGMKVVSNHRMRTEHERLHIAAKGSSTANGRLEAVARGCTKPA
jgi:hypothetical protein